MIKASVELVYLGLLLIERCNFSTILLSKNINIMLVTIVKWRAVDWSTIQFWILLAKGHSM